MCFYLAAHTGEVPVASEQDEEKMEPNLTPPQKTEEIHHTQVTLASSNGPPAGTHYVALSPPHQLFSLSPTNSI